MKRTGKRKSSYIFTAPTNIAKPILSAQNQREYKRDNTVDCWKRQMRCTQRRRKTNTFFFFYVFVILIFSFLLCLPAFLAPPWAATLKPQKSTRTYEYRLFRPISIQHLSLCVRIKWERQPSLAALSDNALNAAKSRLQTSTKIVRLILLLLYIVSTSSCTFCFFFLVVFSFSLVRWFNKSAHFIFVWFICSYNVSSSLHLFSLCFE